MDKLNISQKELIKKVKDLIGLIEDNEASNKLMVRLRTTEEELLQKEKEAQEIRQFLEWSKVRYRVMLHEFIKDWNSCLSSLDPGRLEMHEQTAYEHQMQGKNLRIVVRNQFFSIHQQVRYPMFETHQQITEEQKQELCRKLLMDLMAIGATAQNQSEYTPPKRDNPFEIRNMSYQIMKSH